MPHGGTLFLDEVSDLSPHAQVALLRAVQEREITRLGGDERRSVNVRVLCASHQPLSELVRAGRFRADLYFRLNQMTLSVPPLRERRDDIPLLIEHWLPAFSASVGRDLRGITARFRQRLLTHAWPGNVRELHHAVMRAALLEDGSLLDGRHFTATSPSAAPTIANNTDAPRTATERRQAARAALSSAKGNKAAAARALGVTRRTFYAWLG